MTEEINATEFVEYAFDWTGTYNIGGSEDVLPATRDLLAGKFDEAKKIRADLIEGLGPKATHTIFPSLASTYFSNAQDYGVIAFGKNPDDNDTLFPQVNHVYFKEKHPKLGQEVEDLRKKWAEKVVAISGKINGLTIVSAKEEMPEGYVVVDYPALSGYQIGFKGTPAEFVQAMNQLAKIEDDCFATQIKSQGVDATLLMIPDTAILKGLSQGVMISETRNGVWEQKAITLPQALDFRQDYFEGQVKGIKGKIAAAPQKYMNIDAVRGTALQVAAVSAKVCEKCKKIIEGKAHEQTLKTLVDGLGWVNRRVYRLQKGIDDGISSLPFDDIKTIFCTPYKYTGKFKLGGGEAMSLQEMLDENKKGHFSLVELRAAILSSDKILGKISAEKEEKKREFFASLNSEEREQLGLDEETIPETDQEVLSRIGRILTAKTTAPQKNYKTQIQKFADKMPEPVSPKKAEQPLTGISAPSMDNIKTLDDFLSDLKNYAFQKQPQLVKLPQAMGEVTRSTSLCHTQSIKPDILADFEKWQRAYHAQHPDEKITISVATLLDEKNASLSEDEKKQAQSLSEYLQLRAYRRMMQGWTYTCDETVSCLSGDGALYMKDNEVFSGVASHDPAVGKVQGLMDKVNTFIGAHNDMFGQDIVDVSDPEEAYKKWVKTGCEKINDALSTLAENRTPEQQQLMDILTYDGVSEEELKAILETRKEQPKAQNNMALFLKTSFLAYQDKLQNQSPELQDLRREKIVLEKYVSTYIGMYNGCTSEKWKELHNAFTNGPGNKTSVANLPKDNQGNATKVKDYYVENSPFHVYLDAVPQNLPKVKPIEKQQQNFDERGVWIASQRNPFMQTIGAMAGTTANYYEINNWVGSVAGLETNVKMSKWIINCCADQLKGTVNDMAGKDLVEKAVDTIAKGLKEKQEKKLDDIKAVVGENMTDEAFNMQGENIQTAETKTVEAPVVPKVDESAPVKVPQMQRGH